MTYVGCPDPVEALDVFKSTAIFVYIIFIYLFGVLHHFEHCTGDMMTGSSVGRGNQCIQFV